MFGGLGVMAEGRCSLSSYATGKSPNMQGVCSPASHVAYEQTAQGTNSRLGGFTINRFGPQEPAGYPTLCKGRFSTEHGTGYIFEDPVSLDATTLLAGRATPASPPSRSRDASAGALMSKAWCDISAARSMRSKAGARPISRT